VIGRGKVQIEPVAWWSCSTCTEDEVTAILAAIADDRLGHAWELALSGLRRGEISGLRWADVDLKAMTGNRTPRIQLGKLLLTF
jgi:integrase